MADLVFLHGGNHGSWCWDPFLPEMRKSQRFKRILTLDMPGCGNKRERDINGVTLASIVAELNQDIRDAKFSDVVLIGHSIAGVLVPMMAAADPSLFSKLIFLSTCIPLEGKTIMETMGTALQGQDPEEVGWPLEFTTTPQMEQVQAMFGPDLTPDQFGWLMSELVQDKMPRALDGEPVTREGYHGVIPATYIVTLRDPILPPDWQRKFAQRAHCTSVVELDTPHEPFISHPVLLAETLERVLSEKDHAISGGLKKN